MFLVQFGITFGPLLTFMKALRCLLLALAVPLAAPAAFPTLFMKPVCLEQFHSPTDIVSAPGDSSRLFICDQTGKIYVFTRGMLLPEPFLDLSPSGLNRVFVDPTNLTNYSERGLLGLAFHPGYGNPASPGYRRFYLNYTALSTEPTANPSTPQDCVTVIAEFRVSDLNPNRADAASERMVLSYG